MLVITKLRPAPRRGQDEQSKKPNGGTLDLRIVMFVEWS
jgi:hypothetical protein